MNRFSSAGHKFILTLRSTVTKWECIREISYTRTARCFGRYVT